MSGRSIVRRAKHATGRRLSGKKLQTIYASGRVHKTIHRGWNGRNRMEYLVRMPTGEIRHIKYTPGKKPAFKEYTQDGKLTLRVDYPRRWWLVGQTIRRETVYNHPGRWIGRRKNKPD